MMTNVILARGHEIHVRPHHRADDVGLDGMPHVEPVSADAAFEVFRANLDRLRALLFRAVPKIGPQPECVCASALGSAVVH